MTDTPDYTRKVQLGATGDMTVVQDDAKELKVEIHQPATKESFKVIQAVAANLKATVTQSSTLRSVVNAIAANLKVEIHQPATKEDFKVIQATAASLKATVTQLAKDRTVTCNTASNLKSEITPAAAAEFLNYPRIPTGATQITKDQADVTQTTVVFHTVDTGKTFYLSSAMLAAEGTAIGSAFLSVWNGSDVIQYHLIRFKVLPNDFGYGDRVFLPPLEIPEGWDMVVQAIGPNFWASAHIHGYEV